MRSLRKAASFLAVLFLSLEAAGQAAVTERRASPVLEIPSEGGGYRFSIIGAIERLADGRLVALETVDRSLIIFDSAGQFVRALGRVGDGPGEFRWPQSLGLRWDSLWVGDATHRRITTFGPSLEVAGTQTHTSAGVPWRTVNGGAVVLPLIALARNPTSQSAVVIAHAPGSLLRADTVIAVPFLAGALVIEAGGMQRLAPQPFADVPLIQASRDGRGVVVVHRDTRQSGATTVRIQKVAADGAPVFDVRLPYSPVPVAKALIDREVARVGDIVQRRMPHEPRAAIDQRTREALYVPSHAPAISVVLSAQNGSTWLRRVSDGRSPVRWTVLDREGRVTFEVRLPPDADVLWVGDDLFAATRRDEDNVPSVVLYRLH
jgi:hypothetical protein